VSAPKPPWRALAVLVFITTTACGSAEPGLGSGDSPTTGSASPSETAGLTLVAIGDSIPFNSSDDCPGCTGFVDRYAEAVGAATGQPVEVLNLSQHTGLTLPQLLNDLDAYEEDLAGADVILVGIAHNSALLAQEHPCGAPFTDGGLPDWSSSKIDEACAIASADAQRPRFESLFSQIAAWREGKPTILRTINRYNDWIGWPDANFGPAENRKTKVALDLWNAMLCEAAEANGFVCVDIYRVFNGPDGLTPSGRLLADDYTHPSDRGNEVIADALVEAGFAPLA